jgi:hypothetical protein
MLNFKKYVLALALLCAFGPSAIFADETPVEVVAQEEETATQDHAVEVPTEDEAEASTAE